MNILLAEDEPGAVIIIRRLLGPIASRLDDTDSLAAVFGLVVANSYDVLILDLKLTDAGRLESIGSIPRIKAISRAVVIAISGSMEPEIKTKCLDAGADAFIAKAEDDGGAAALLAAISAIVIHDEKPENSAQRPHVAALERLVGKDDKPDAKKG